MDSKVIERLDSFFTRFKKYTYKKGDVLLRADDIPTGIFYLQKGIVKEYALSQNGDEIVLNIFKPLSFFPMAWAMNNTPNNYFYEAVTDIEVWKASKEKVVTFLKKEPNVLFDLLSRIYKGLDGLFFRLAYRMSGNAQSRLIAEILIQARRFGKKNENASIVVLVTEKELAIQAGMTRETVSREMKKLKQKNILEVYTGRLIVKNIQQLEKELAQQN